MFNNVTLIGNSIRDSPFTRGKPLRGLGRTGSKAHKGAHLRIACEIEACDLLPKTARSNP